ncbi:MAG: hypothetical protein ACLP3R_16240 [Candidatus Korobacteraceae bacterium]
MPTLPAEVGQLSLRDSLAHYHCRKCGQRRPKLSRLKRVFETKTGAGCVGKLGPLGKLGKLGELGLLGPLGPLGVARKLGVSVVGTL